MRFRPMGRSFSSPAEGVSPLLWWGVQKKPPEMWIVLPSPGRASRADLGPALAGKLSRTDQHPVPNRPGLRPGLFGNEFSKPALSRPWKTGPMTGSTIEQLKEGNRWCLMACVLCHGSKSQLTCRNLDHKIACASPGKDYPEFLWI
jgi:hypothetical protein